MAGKLNGALLLDPDNLAKPDFSQMVPFKPKVSEFSITIFGKVQISRLALNFKLVLKIRKRSFFELAASRYPVYLIDVFRLDFKLLP